MVSPKPPFFDFLLSPNSQIIKVKSEIGLEKPISDEKITGFWLLPGST